MAKSVERVPLVLASASPRRRQLLEQLGIRPDEVDPPEINEDVLSGELPTDYARRMAAAKAAAVAARHPSAFVLGADTVVAAGRRILAKAAQPSTAERCLRRLSGRKHRVIGGIALVCPTGSRIERIVQTSVQFKRLTDTEIQAYLDSREWEDKAGGYAIQGKAAAFVNRIAGSYSNVVGLPLFEVAAILQGAGYRW